MIKKESLAYFKQLGESREAALKLAVLKEGRHWREAYKNDPYCLEKELICDVIGYCHNPQHFGRIIEVSHTVTKTLRSGLEYLNISQLTEVMQRAGLPISIGRDTNGIDSSVNLTVKKYSYDMMPSVLESSVIVEEKKLDELIRHGKQDWLVKAITAFWRYRMNEEGKAITEQELAAFFYNQLTDALKNYLGLDPRLLFAGNNRPIEGTDWLVRGAVIRPEYGDFEKSVQILEKDLNDTNLVLVTKDDEKDPYRMKFMVKQKDASYPIDPETGESRLKFVLNEE